MLYDTTFILIDIICLRKALLSRIMADDGSHYATVIKRIAFVTARAKMQQS